MKLPPTIPSPSNTPQLEEKSDLAGLLRRLSLLYRVYDEGSSTVLTDDGFIANAFAGSANVSEILERYPTDDDYRELLRHVRNRHRGANSPWISITPLWLWAIVECVKRCRAGEKGVGLALIDNAQLALSRDVQQVFYAMERNEIRDDHLASQWSNDPQEILIFAALPRKAIISQVLFADIIPHLPPFFFKSHHCRAIENICWRNVRTWDRFYFAHNELLSSLQQHRDATSPHSHGKRAYDLARSLIEPKWQEVTNDILEEGQEAGEEIIRSRDKEALSHKMFMMRFDTTALTAEDFDVEAQASMKLNELTTIIRTLAGKIASWGIDWNKDVDGSAWKEVQHAIIQCTKEAQSEVIDQVGELLGCEDELNEWGSSDDSEADHEDYSSNDVLG